MPDVVQNTDVSELLQTGQGACQIRDPPNTGEPLRTQNINTLRVVHRELAQPTAHEISPFRSRQLGQKSIVGPRLGQIDTKITVEIVDVMPGERLATEEEVSLQGAAAAFLATDMEQDG